MSREYGRGSIVSFIVVGVLLVALVLGGLYLVKNQLPNWASVGADKPGDDSREIARQDSASDSDAATDDDTDAAEPVGDDTAPTADTATPTDNDEAEADNNDDSGAAEPANPSGEADDQSAEAGDDSAEDEALPTTGVSLPQTGLTDSLLSAVPLVLLVAATVAYRRSNLL